MTKNIVALFLVIFMALALFQPINVMASFSGEYVQISTAEAHPREDITFTYSFRVEEDAHYFIHFCKAGTPTCESHGYKDLDPDKNGDRIVGSFTVKAPSDLGQYEFRVYGREPNDNTTLFKSIASYCGDHQEGVLDPYTTLLHWYVNLITNGDPHPTVVLVLSPPITVTQYNTSISCPSSAQPGESVTVGYQEASLHSFSWMGLFRSGAPDYQWESKVLLNGETNGSKTVVMPPTEGSYEFRFFYDQAYTRTGTKPINVAWQTYNTTISSISSPQKVGREVTVTFTNAPRSGWIGLFKESSPDQSPEGYRQDIRFDTNGTFKFIPSYAERHNVRVFDVNNRLVATSNSFEVAAADAPATTPVPVLTAQPGFNSVTLTWTPTSYAAGLFQGYDLFRYTTPGGPIGNPITDFHIQGTSHTDYNVENGKIYYYVVKVYFDSTNGWGSASNEVTVTPGQGEGTIVLTVGDPWLLVNGVRTEIDPGQGTAPVLVNSRTFVPIRAIVETLGGTLGYEPTEKMVTINLGDKTIQLWIGRKNAVVNGVQTTNDVAPYLSSTGRTMLPLRFVIENLGCQSVWDSVTQKITITSTLPIRVPVTGNQQATGPGGPGGTIPGGSGGSTPGGTGTGNSGGTLEPPQQLLNWTGRWDTNFGILNLTQNGNQVTGSYPDGTLSGTASQDASGNNLLTGTFDEGEGNRGPFTFTMSAGIMSFTGTWHYNGSTENRSWAGSRVN